MAKDFTFDNPRVLMKINMAAGTIYTLKSLILASIQEVAFASSMFVDDRVADQAARFALAVPDAEYTRSDGYIVYQVDNTTFYRLVDTANIDNADGWDELTGPEQTITYQKFVSNLSWKVKLDSSIKNDAAGTDMYLLGRTSSADPNATAGQQPDSGAIEAYGVLLAADEERTFSGHSDNLWLYSAGGTSLILDLVFEPGG